ncbi:MAG: DUF1697 domain-containing protein, partial [Pseudomonadota bacterium]
MISYVALLRAVNVGGTGKLPMKDLVAIAASAGLAEPRTYIQSGNLLFRSDAAEAELVARIEAALTKDAGLQTDVLVRTREGLASVVE